MPRLPEADFVTIAVDLAEFTAESKRTILAWEIMRERGQINAPGVEHTVKELAAAAKRADELQRFFVEMAPYEEIMRDFVAGLAERRQESGLAAAFA